MASFKRECWTASEVRCPFYMSDDRKEISIRCEGYGEKMEVNSRFRTLAQKNMHMGKFCVGRYERCPMYRLTYGEKYADD